MGGGVFKTIAPIVGGLALGPAGLGLTSAALGAGIGGAAAGLSGGGGLKGALLGGATGYGGSLIGDSIGSSLTSSLGKVGASNALTNNIANSTIGRVASNVIGPATGSSLIGGVAGRFAGNSIADSLGSSLFPEEVQSGDTSSEKPFQASRQAQLTMPGSLTNYNGLDDQQQSSNLATQGVYGGGLGQEEQGYFTNLINRRLVDDAGNVDSDLSDINPIEKSYLSQLGLNQDNPQSLLEALSKWKAT